MGTRFSGGNTFCVLLQVDDLLQKVDRRLCSSETEFRKHNVLSSAHTLTAAIYDLAVSFFHCGIPHRLGGGNVLNPLQFLMIEVGTLVVFELILRIVPFS